MLDENRHLWSKKKGLVAKPRGNSNIEDFQKQGWAALCDDESTHILLAGGARSGKTYLIIKYLIIRAFYAPEGSQVILRFRFNHLKASIINDTFPSVCKNEWPGERLFYFNRSDWFAEFSNGHKIYFGGLDDKDRTEKILGQGHLTIFNNEISQISYSSRNKAVTRLSQKIAVPGSRYGYMPLKEINDENPPMEGHWSYRLWIKGVDPASGAPVINPKSYRHVFMQPANNPHIPEATKNILRSLPKRERVRFWEGKFGESTDNPLWTYESIEASRIEFAPKTLTNVVVAIDPSGTKGKEDERSDEVGIVVAATDINSNVYILEDASGRYPPQGEDGWGAIATRLYHKYKADRIIGEVNFGGAMVAAVVNIADPDVPFKELHASRGKAVRAEPIATLFDKRKVFLVGNFPELEEQLLQFSSSGYNGEKSPDRADAMVWAVSDLALDLISGLGLMEFYRQSNDSTSTPTPTLPSPDVIQPSQSFPHVVSLEREAIRPSNEMIMMSAPEGIAGTFYSRSGRVYNIEDGTIKVLRNSSQELVDSGFKEIL